ncbi:hypothetical protein ISCGN_010241 [Ixodes scapularis]
MSTPTKAQCFSFNVPADTPVDAIMDSIQAVAGGDGLSYLQHHGGVRFMAAVSTMAAAQRLVAQGFLSLGNVEVHLKPVGAHVVFVSVYRLPPYVSEEALVQVLAQYGKVKAINHVTFRDCPDVRTGTRVVKMEMSKPVPNFVHIQGHRVMVDYRGCTAPCQRCGHSHATTDCVQRKSYAAAAKQPREDRPRTSQRVVGTVSDPAPQLSGDDSDPSIRPRTPPPPPVVSDSDALSNAGVSDSQASGVPSNAADPTDGQTSDIPWNADAIPGSQASRVSSNAAGSQASRVPSNVAAKPDCQTSDASSNAAAILESHSIDSEDLSDDSDRLFIADEGDVTPGQGHPPLTPEASTTTTSRESSAESASPDADMPDDRSDAKRVFSPASGGSDASPASSAKKKRLGADNFDYAEEIDFRNGHTPARDFFRSLLQYVSEDGFFFLCGDFNCVIDSSRDVRGPGRGRNTSDAQELVRLLGLHDLRDAWIELHGAAYDSTWSRGTSSSRLDRVYVQQHLASRLLSCEVLSFPSAAGYVSDHRPVSAVFDVSGFLYPRGDTWRLDISLLRDEPSISSLRQSIRASLIAIALSPAQWDALKSDCRFFATAAGKSLRRRKTEALNEVVRRIRIVQRGGVRTSLMFEYLTVLRDRHQRLLSMSSRSAVAQRLCDQPVEDPEVLRCLRATRAGGNGYSYVPNVHIADGSLSEDPREIGAVFRTFFSSLFFSDPAVNISNFAERVRLFCGDLPACPDDLGSSLFRPTTREELFDVLRAMKVGNAPNPDGLSAEFYVTFWDVLGNPLVQLVNGFLETGEVPPSFRRGRVILLPKEGGSSSDPAAWRPITLLNADYKIVASLLVSRLRTVMPHVICNFPLPGRDSVMVSAYADDVSLFVRNSDSFEAARQLFLEYGAPSGACLNTTKSQALEFGGSPPALPADIQIVNELRVLGVFFDSRGVAPRTWEVVASAVERQVAVAGTFTLSLRDRAYLVRAVFCGQLFYVAHIALPPSRFASRITSSLFRFYCSRGTELVTRSVLRLPTSLGGRGMPCVSTVCRLLSLRTVLGVLDDTDHPARSLALYFRGPSRRVLVPRALGNLYPSAEATPPFYQAVVACQEELRQALPDLEVREVPPARVVEELCVTRITREQRDRTNAFPWTWLVSRRLPGPVEDFEWRRNWGVLPTRQRLHRWGIVPDPQCPNCGQVETNTHVFFDCTVARSFWRQVHHGFRGIGLWNFVSGGRCPAGASPCSCWQSANWSSGRIVVRQLASDDDLVQCGHSSLDCGVPCSAT